MTRLVMAACLAFAGCVPASLERLESTGTTTTHSTALPWQDAYRRLNDRMQACYDVSGPVTGGVDGQLYADRGEIVMRFQRGPLTNTAGPLVRIEVSPAAAGAAVTVTHAQDMLARKIASRIGPWLAGETACR